MKPFHESHKPKPRKFRIEQPCCPTSEQQRLWREARKYAELIPFEPEPNMGRVREIKEEIEKGTYLTPEVIEETVARLAIRFMKKE